MRFILPILIALLLAACAGMPARSGYDRASGSYKSNSNSAPKKVAKQKPVEVEETAEEVAEETKPEPKKEVAAAPKAQAKPKAPASGTWEAAAKPWLGTPYKYGGSTKKGVDCSGLVMQLYKEVRGKSMPHHAADLYKGGSKVSRDDLREGDLVFFGSMWKIDHVGIYLKGDRFVHASSSKGVMISPMNDIYWSPKYQGARRY